METDKYISNNEKKYSTRNVIKQHFVRQFLVKTTAVVEECLRKLHKNDILDVGCGEGIVDNFLCDNIPEIKITALDCSEEALEKAKERNSESVCFEQGDACHLKYENGSFGTVICLEVLEHLENPAKALQELWRVSDRFIVVSVPHEPWFCMGNFLSGNNMSRFGRPEDHRRCWTSFGFEKFIKQSLGNVKCVKYNLWFWTLVVIEKRW